MPGEIRLVKLTVRNCMLHADFKETEIESSDKITAVSYTNRYCMVVEVK